MMNDIGEVHLFVLWQNARAAEARIMEDIRSRFEVIAAFPATWPGNISAATAFKRFYGTFLIDPKGKAKRAGGGEFLVVIVRDKTPEYKFVETVRGLEKVDINIFERKNVYRSWVGGQHRVHGTNSTEEARRDIMLLTGQPLSKWIDKTAVGEPLSVLKNNRVWLSLREMFTFLNETISYVILRNECELPDSFDPLHDDIDILVKDASDCVGLLNARKIKKSGSLYGVNVAGHEIKLDIRSIGDGYYDEAWQRKMLATRIQNKKNIFVLSPENRFYALIYHAVFQKRFIAADYPIKATDAAAEIGVTGETFADWTRALETFMVKNRYRPSYPLDKSVTFNANLFNWHVHAIEAAQLFNLSDIQLSNIEDCALNAKNSHTEIIFKAQMGNTTVQVEYGQHLQAFSCQQFKITSAFFSSAPQYAIRPINWHAGRKGAYFISEKAEGQSLRARLVYGAPLSEDEANCIAASTLNILNSLEGDGVYHRDIRPENLFIPKEGGIKLTGFRFAVSRKDYSKEISWLRKKPLYRLAPIGGDYVFEPGRWNDAWSLAKCLELIPQTQTVVEIHAKLLEKSNCKGATLCVCLPARKRISMFFVWLKLTVQDAFRSDKRLTKKRRTLRMFAYNAWHSRDF